MSHADPPRPVVPEGLHGSSALRVRVPASTSNLGPGFDLLGLALGLWVEVEARPAAPGSGVSVVERTGTASGWPTAQTPVHAASDLSADSDLLLRALAGTARPWPDLELRVHSEIPVARGLGSSGAAIGAGLLLGSALCESPPSFETLLARGIELEGHPDNIAASLRGGLTACHPDAGPGGAPQVVDLPVHESLRVVVAWPARPQSTAEARAALPERVSFEDAVENPRRLALLLEGLRNGDPHLLASGFVDRLHEHYRLELQPGARDALRAAREAGALAAGLSGSGSALVAFAVDDAAPAEIAEAMRATLQRRTARFGPAEARACSIVRQAPAVSRHPL